MNTNLKLDKKALLSTQWSVVIFCVLPSISVDYKESKSW